MNPTMQKAERELRGLVDASPITEGMTIRVTGSHLCLGRQLPPGPFSDAGPDDRVRFTHLEGATFGLSVRRHTGRWEKAPFSGSLQELIEVVTTVMQHLVADL